MRGGLSHKGDVHVLCSSSILTPLAPASVSLRLSIWKGSAEN